MLVKLLLHVWRWSDQRLTNAYFFFLRSAHPGPPYILLSHPFDGSHGPPGRPQPEERPWGPQYLFRSMSSKVSLSS